MRRVFIDGRDVQAVKQAVDEYLVKGYYPILLPYEVNVLGKQLWLAQLGVPDGRE